MTDKELIEDIDKVDSKRNIVIKGARQHNLKNINVVIPRNTFTVITGVSGSGKSSLAFDTLYAEGQRRYVESLSSYARQFLARLEKPEVDYIKGISPAIAIEQKVITRNPRSTVGTTTEIYDFLKIFYARVGQIYSPVTGKLVQIDSTDEVVEQILKQEGKKGIVYVSSKYLKSKEISELIAEGYSRGRINNDFVKLQDLKNTDKGKFDLVLDRFTVSNNSDFISLIKDSIDLVYEFTDGYCSIDIYDGEKVKTYQFSKHLEADGVVFEEPSINLFNFNSPTGACPKCEGFGQILGISEDLVIPDKTLSLFNNAVIPWKSESNSKYLQQFLLKASEKGFPIHKPYLELTLEQKRLLWKGDKQVKGIDDFFDYLQSKIYKIQNRVLISRYKGKTICNECEGSRLKKEALCVKIDGKTIAEVGAFSIKEALIWISTLKLNAHGIKVSERILAELKSRLTFLNDVGVGYITLNRSANTLSGGESQRINLAGSLGSALVGALYVLDEPSIGLHPKDTQKLIGVLKQLNALGNTVIVVEHDEDIMRSANYIIDIGPKAGSLGGEVVYQGDIKNMLKCNTLTANYLNKKLNIEPRKSAALFNKKITLKNAYKNNLKIQEISIPLNCLCVITGVSGSGKSTLLLEELVPEIKSHLAFKKSEKLSGDLNLIQHLEYVDQNPIGRSSRSNPTTYVKAFDDIRTLYSNLPMSKLRDYKPGFFSLNVPGGRCENCQGEGYVAVEMQFMADLKIKCTECAGKKFKDEILEAKYHDKNISELLDLTVDDAIVFFYENANSKKTSLEDKIIQKLQPLQDVGLGYIKLGQSSSTLSGGEAQRVKLAYFLVKGNSQKNTLFIFDEPTTGLHFHDVKQLLQSFYQLIEQGNSIIVIEHNMDVARCADWLIELGPEGGTNGGQIMYQGKEFFK